MIEIKVPDLGGAAKADVIAINVKVGDTVAVDDALVTLEGDKASMDIPSPEAGVVKAIKLALGDKVSEGSVILMLDAEKKEEKSEKAPEKSEALKTEQPISSTSNADVYAGPVVRRMAREQGIDLTTVQGSARGGRITKEDIEQYIGGDVEKTAAEQSVTVASTATEEIMPLNKIKRITAETMLRAWTIVPHVTQFESADITNLEAFREKHKISVEKQGYKLTPLAFVVKAIAHALQKFPTFNASLDEKGENLILKKYYHIGVAVDTPNGLVVPVLRDVDKKSVSQIAKEMAALGAKAREKTLMPKDMMGSTFTVSSLGGIGGTAFTPIVNLPNVAILGVSKAKIQPVYQDNAFVPRLMLPLSLSYDHRVIDGAEAARFSVYLSACLEDLTLLLL